MDISESRRERIDAPRRPRSADADTVGIVVSSLVGGRAVAQAIMPRRHHAARAAATVDGSANDQAVRRQQELRHDIRHGLGMVMLLASLLDSATDVGPDSRQRARQILHEARWLDLLQRAHDQGVSELGEQRQAADELIRLDLFAADVLEAVKLSMSTTIELSAEEVSIRTDRLALWRAVRNMVGNAIRAAGPRGRVHVTIEKQDHLAVVQVEDDGPGFGAVPQGTESLGLDILQKFTAAWGGHLEIGRGALGGCRVRLSMPSEPSYPVAAHTDRPVRLLICDDHAVFAESLGHVLTLGGKEVVAIAHHPDQAIELMRRDPADICLLDVWFGSTTALDRLAEIRAAAPDTRIVLLTARMDESLVAAAWAAGIAGIAEKSQAVAEIIDLLDRVAAGESVLPSARPEPAATGPARHPQTEGQRLAGFLTPREREVLSALVRGEDTTRLARKFGISSATARCHVQNVLTKLGAHSRLEAATAAVRYGMIDPETGEWLTGAGHNGRTQSPS